MTLAIRAKRSRCALHPDINLRVAMHEGTPQITCLDCKAPVREFVEAESIRSTYLRGGRVPAALTTHMQGGPMTTDQTTALALRKLDPVAIEAQVKRLSGMIEGFGALKKPQAKLAVQLLDAGFHESHFNIMHGNLFMNMDGRQYWAARTFGKAWGGVTHRIMTEDERKAYQLHDQEVGVVATVFKLVPGIGKVEIATDMGRAGGPRDAAQAVAKAHKPEMAIKRARSRALRAAAPLGVDMSLLDTVVEEITDEEAAALTTPEDVTQPTAVTNDEPEPDVEELEWEQGQAEPDEEAAAEFREIEEEPEADDVDEPEAEVVQPEPEPAPKPMAELDLGVPYGKPRTETEVDVAYASFVRVVRGEVEANKLRQVHVNRFEWGSVKARKAVIGALTEGWSPAQVVGLIKLQEEERDAERTID